MSKPKELKFEDAIKRLEKITEELENGEFDLDKAVEIFEEGLKLSKFCKKRLDEAVQKIEIIKKQNINNIAKDSDINVADEKKEDYDKEETQIGLLLNTDGSKSNE
ncbi:MAG: exodeoxyribonuclease VII small subunit [Spirochaetes bacterium]|nr:exodeoxyribonuclease VII small subunit [Spirochaetota bacterium]